MLSQLTAFDKALPTTCFNYKNAYLPYSVYLFTQDI